MSSSVCVSFKPYDLDKTRCSKCLRLKEDHPDSNARKEKDSTAKRTSNAKSTSSLPTNTINNNSTMKNSSKTPSRSLTTHSVISTPNHYSGSEKEKEREIGNEISEEKPKKRSSKTLKTTSSSATSTHFSSSEKEKGIGNEEIIEEKPKKRSSKILKTSPASVPSTISTTSKTSSRFPSSEKETEIIEPKKRLSKTLKTSPASVPSTISTTSKTSSRFSSSEKEKETEIIEEKSTKRSSKTLKTTPSSVPSTITSSRFSSSEKEKETEIIEEKPKKRLSKTLKTTLTAPIETSENLSEEPKKSIQRRATTMPSSNQTKTTISKSSKSSTQIPKIPSTDEEHSTTNGFTTTTTTPSSATILPKSSMKSTRQIQETIPESDESSISTKSTLKKPKKSGSKSTLRKIDQEEISKHVTIGGNQVYSVPYNPTPSSSVDGTKGPSALISYVPKRMNPEHLASGFIQDLHHEVHQNPKKLLEGKSFSPVEVQEMAFENQQEILFETRGFKHHPISMLLVDGGVTSEYAFENLKSLKLNPASDSLLVVCMRKKVSLDKKTHEDHQTFLEHVQWQHAAEILYGYKPKIDEMGFHNYALVSAEHDDLKVLVDALCIQYELKMIVLAQHSEEAKPKRPGGLCSWALKHIKKQSVFVYSEELDGYLNQHGGLELVL